GVQAFVLDVGCGRQDCYAKKVRFGSKISRLIGFDVRQDLNTSLDLAVRANVYELPFASAKFDVALSDFVLEHLEQPERAFAEIARVLKSGGRFVFRTPNLYHYVPVAALLLRKVGYQAVERSSTNGDRHEVFPTLYRANTCHRLGLLARRTGFAVERMIFAEGGPHYLEFFLPFYLIGVIHQYLVNKVPLLHGLRGNIIGVFRKEGTG
ncbi:MAG: methyltransferase domain-containing protein, partial [candidate division NC10 bacterium]|nr:methyltransferase domain-containing protein [candidate division NC10 bacterium]